MTGILVSTGMVCFCILFVFCPVRRTKRLPSSCPGAKMWKQRPLTELHSKPPTAICGFVNQEIQRRQEIASKNNWIWRAKMFSIVRTLQHHKKNWPAHIGGCGVWWISRSILDWTAPAQSSLTLKPIFVVASLTLLWLWSVLSIWYDKVRCFKVGKVFIWLTSTTCSPSC